MVCCVIVAMMFALPFILMRGLHGLFAGGSCSMAWRPVSQSLLSEDKSVTKKATTGGGIERSRPDKTRLDFPAGACRDFTIVDRAKSFRYAGRGAVRLLRFEHSAWIQLSLAGVAIVLAVMLNISLADWRWIIVACGLVLSLEGLNTAVERTCDRISVAYCGQIKVAKDVAAGAVLLGSIAAALIGILTFLPYVASSYAVVADSSHENRAGALGVALPVLPSTETDYSRFGVFHCINPVPANSAFSENVEPGSRVKAGV